MTNGILLVGYDVRGRRVAQIESASDTVPARCELVAPSPNATLALARIAVVAPNEPQRYLLFDFEPTPNGLPSGTNRFQVTLAPGTDATVTQVTFRGRIRRLLPVEGPMWVEAVLIAKADKLEWQRLVVHAGLNAVHFDVAGAAKLAGQSGTFSADAFSAAMLRAVGLRFYGLSLARFEFAVASRPVQESDSLENLETQLVAASPPDAPIVVQLLQTITLYEEAQTLRAGQMVVDLDPDAVRRAGLSSSGLTLVQTHAGLNADGKLNPRQGAWIVGFQGIPMLPTLAAYNQAATRYLASLQTVDAGRPISGVPLFDTRVWDPSTSFPQTEQPSDTEFKRTWTFTLDVSDRLNEEVTLNPAHFGQDVLLGFRAAFLNQTGPTDDKAHEYAAWLPGLARHDFYRSSGAPAGPPLAGVVAFDCVIQPVPALLGDNAPSDSLWRGFTFQFQRRYRDTRSSAAVSSPLQWVRMGSLDLGFPPPLDPLDAKYFDGAADGTGVPTNRGVPDHSVIEGRQRSLITLGWRDAQGNWSPDIPTVALELQMRIDHGLPGGQDGFPSEPFEPVDATELAALDPADSSPSAARRRFMREPALVIPALDSTGVLPMRQYLFRLRERTARFQSQILAVQLFEWGVSGVNPSAVTSLPLVVLDRQPFMVSMVIAPPLVGIGGADGNLEVGNWSGTSGEGASWELAGATDGFTLLFPPQAVGEGMEKHAWADVTDDRPAQFRLSPISRFELDASFFRQNFTEATWNLRRILGYPGQRAPGAGIRTLNFELLYGLACTVTASGLRLAELASRLGDVARTLPPRAARVLGVDEDQHDLDFLGEDNTLSDLVFSRFNYRWSRIYSAYNSRLGVYEPWLSGQSSLLLRSDVDYLLRQPDQIMQNPTTVPDLPISPGPAPTDSRLAGGALWGFEFQAEYDPFVKLPDKRRSTAGELSHPAFSALGGWGHQKAVFQFGLTAIYSDTAMGRTFFYSVERRGRIAGYWNFAKHVVIYERTVGTSIQFRPQRDANGKITIPSQDHLAGRPVLRKVREFVEILQPRREYPDLGGDEVARGCVQGIEFLTKIIPVDSRWGHDVIDFDSQGNPQPVGYTIPLWQPGADPAVYPKPHVALRMAGAAAQGELLVHEKEDPQKLLFFSIADVSSPDQANSDTWPAFRGVDFPDLDFPRAPEPRLPADGNIEQTVPDEMPVAAGYEAFTYQLVGGKPVNLVANRTDRAVGAVLRNVALVRANPKAQDPSTSTTVAQKAVDARISAIAARDAMDRLGSLLPGNLADPAARRDVFDAAATIDAQVQSGADALKTVFTGAESLLKSPRDFTTLTNQALDRWKKDLSQAVQDELVGRLANRIDGLAGSTVENARRTAAHYARESFDIVRLAAAAPDPGIQELLKLLDSAVGLPGEIVRQTEAVIAEQIVAIQALLEFALPDTVLPDPIIEELTHRVDSIVGELVAPVARLVNQAVDALGKHFDISLVSPAGGPGIRQLAGTFADSLRKWRLDFLAVLEQPADEVLDQLDELWSTLHDLQPVLDGAIKGLKDLANSLRQKVDEFLNLGITGATSKLRDLVDIEPRVQHLLDHIAAAADAEKVADAVHEAIRSVDSDLSKLATAGGIAGLTAFTDSFQQFVHDNPLCKPINDAAALSASIQSTVNDIKQQAIKDLFDNTADLDELARKLKDRLDEARSRFNTLVNGLAQPLAARFPLGLAQQGSTVLRLVRAFGDAPLVEGMGFNRRQLAYFYDPLTAIKGTPIDMSPAVALVNRVGGQLKAMGVSLPTGKLLEQVLPAKDELLQKLDFGKLLPDFAGLKLGSLLPDLKAPSGLKDKVKITQDFDKQSGRGWVQADIRIPMGGPSTLFDGGAFMVSLRDVLFTARVRIEAGLSGAPKRTQWGKLHANWDLTVGGTAMVTFLDTELSFDESGKTNFTLDPTKIQLNGLLSMLSDVLKTVSDPDGGFTLRLKEDKGFPVGVEAILDLPLPDLAFGVCAMSNLRFGAELSLLAVPEFAIAVRAHVCEKMAPFTLTIFILGGGGWLDVRGRYLPLSSRLSTSVSLGLSAGAMLAIAFGPVKGFVFAFFFVEGEMVTESGQSGSQLIIRVGLLLGGEVDVCGLVTVSIRLLLELEYSGSSGELVGRGTLSIRVKVCFFLTISFSRTVEKRLAGGGGQRQVSEADQRKRISDACDNHLSRTA